MNFNWKLCLYILFLVVGQARIAEGTRKPDRVKKSQQSKLEKIVTVRYCDLIKDQAKYTGQLIRVRATVLSWLDATTLYDSACEEVGLEPVFDCKDDEECSGMAKQLQKDTDYHGGDVERVEAVLIGRLVLHASTTPGKSRSEFVIKKIEQ